jgi:hypothetical protein
MKNKLTRRLVVSVAAILIAGVGVVAFAPTAWAAADGTIAIEIYKAGFIAGVSGGKGTLIYKGKKYPLSIGGVSLGATIGASKAELVGEVFNLRNVADIAGTYSATQAGYAVAGGNKVADLKNSKGVQLKVKGKQIGLEFALDLSGLQIDLQK